MHSQATRHLKPVIWECCGPCKRNPWGIQLQSLLGYAGYHSRGSARVPAYLKKGAKSGQFDVIARGKPRGGSHAKSGRFDVMARDKPRGVPTHARSSRFDVISRDKSRGVPPHAHSSRFDVIARGKPRGVPPHAKSSQFDVIARDKPRDIPPHAKSSRFDVITRDKPRGVPPHVGRKPSEELRPRYDLRQRARQTPTPTRQSSWRYAGEDPASQRMRRRKGAPTELAPSPEPLSMKPQFLSPPLLPGFLKSVYEAIGRGATPTPIQQLALQHVFPPLHVLDNNGELLEDAYPVWRQFLLASETGSGKSLAYMLPLLQHLKRKEHFPAPLPPDLPQENEFTPTMLAPRGLIIAPTHELARQLTVFAKALIHNEKLRVLCLSRANNSSSSRGRNSTASQMKRNMEEMDLDLATGHGTQEKHPVDLLIGTPMKILELARGWGWNKADQIKEDWEPEKRAKALNWTLGKRQMSLRNVEYVVIDEADVQFDEDFQQSTRQLLADVAVSRGYNHSSFATLKPFPHLPLPEFPLDTPARALDYPYNLIFASATIPSSLSEYITDHHPAMLRLASPGLHRLPNSLRPKYRDYTGNKFSDIEKCVKNIWAYEITRGMNKKSKIIIFCNKSSVVEDLHLYLKEHSIPSVPLTSTSEAREFGSNRHLENFLKPSSLKRAYKKLPQGLKMSPDDPHVLITTSLLSRGLDFSHQVQNVLIIDEPIDMIDFLHRAGRTGRAGSFGNVIVFGKLKGRGSEPAKRAKERIEMLV